MIQAKDIKLNIWYSHIIGPSADKEFLYFTKIELDEAIDTADINYIGINIDTLKIRHGQEFIFASYFIKLLEDQEVISKLNKILENQVFR